MTDPELYTKLQSLALFSGLRNRPPLSGLCALLSPADITAAERSALFSRFAREVLDGGGDLYRQLLCCALEEENPYTDYLISGKGDPALLLPLLDAELEILSEVAAFDGEPVRSERGVVAAAHWKTCASGFAENYKKEILKYRERGFGVFARAAHFLLCDSGELRPVLRPDPVRLCDLVGYTEEREKVVRNTEAFTERRPANNVLLYGDAGTGKSSTVKATVNEYACRGLRAIEIKKHQLFLLPELIDRLACQPLRFILFADDLTFSGDDRDFCALKAILEGGIGGADNILIYATTNHRHMIKENMSEREGAVSVTDCIQEAASLSARFGLTVTFSRPDRELYYKIVSELAKRAGCRMEEEELYTRAEAFALRGAGRSPRSAEQFVRSLFLKSGS